MKFAALVVFFSFSSVASAHIPRFPNPKSPDEIWQNDRDLLANINALEVRLSTTMSSGSTSYIQNSNTLQAGATAYPAFLHVGSSGTVYGPFKVTGILTTSNTAITTAAGLLDATKLTGLVPNTSIDGSSVTKQGNTFNGASQLTQLDSGGALSGVSSATFTNGSIATLKVSTAMWQGFGIRPILRIESTSTTTSSGTTSGTFGNTNLILTIAPKLATSHIVLFVAFQCAVGAGSTASFTLARGGTNLLDATNGFWQGAANYTGHQSYMWIDAPATTSTLTYSLQFKAGAGGVTTLSNGETAFFAAIEIAQ